MIDLNRDDSSDAPGKSSQGESFNGSPKSPAGFDIAAIDSLIRPLIPYFAELTSERIQGLRDGLQRGAMDEIKRLAHTIKGSAASYGFPHFADLAARIEQALTKPEPEARLGSLIEQLAVLQTWLLQKIADEPDLFKETDELEE